ncbi:MAG TPA: ComF family protein [Thermomicrobiales bacterium]|nr:ComF family protein [Thermomicrobiales bacterium]
MLTRRVANFLRIAGGAAVETLYPRCCAGCGRRGNWVCHDCDAALRRFARPWCERCGAPPLQLSCRCADLVPALAVVRSAAPDDGWLRAAVRSFKYSGETARAEHLGALLLPLLADLPPFDALVPVPLHARRERRRGYNQARLLAHAAGKGSSIPIEEVLVRTRPTDQQVGLDADARRKNVRGAFAVNDGADISGRRFVLVDDVLTTGSTLGNCAETLVGGGAAWVGAVTLAREL